MIHGTLSYAFYVGWKIEEIWEAGIWMHTRLSDKDMVQYLLMTVLDGGNLQQQILYAETIPHQSLIS